MRVLKVGAYAKRFQFLQQEHDEVCERIDALDRLFKQHDCRSSEMLLDKAAKTERSLDAWFLMDGALLCPLPFSTLPLEMTFSNVNRLGQYLGGLPPVSGRLMYFQQSA